MIVAIEGPDRTGKTTLWNLLRQVYPNAVFVPSLPVPKELYGLMHLVDDRSVTLWKAMYDRAKLYITDRSLFVSGQVYAQLFRRPQRDYSDWYDELRMVYIRAEPQALVHRYDMWRRDRYKEVAGYDLIARKLKHTVIPFELDNVERVRLASEYIDGQLASERCDVPGQAERRGSVPAAPQIVRPLQPRIHGA